MSFGLAHLLDSFGNVILHHPHHHHQPKTDTSGSIQTLLGKAPPH